jgi:hypothetical protein
MFGVVAIPNPASKSGVPRRVIFALIGMILLLTAGYVAVQRIDTYDSGCGTVFYDTVDLHYSRVCRHPLAVQRAWTVALAAAGLAALAVPSIVAAARRRNRLRIVAVAVGLLAFALLLVGTNRILQPYEEESCGSVVNPVEYEVAHDRWCDDLLAPRRRAAILSFGAGTIGAGAALALFVRSRPTRAVLAARN